MWITRKTYEDQQAKDLEFRKALSTENDRLRRDVIVLANKVTHLKAALASSQANVDWLKVMCNSLSNDRAAVAASKGLTLPNLQIEGTPQPPAAVEHRAEESARPLPEGAGFADLPDDPDHDDPFKGLVGGDFEDVGDELAERMGITHAEDGTVEYVKR